MADSVDKIDRETLLEVLHELRDSCELDFIVMGGSAFTMYTGLPSQDVDVLYLPDGHLDWELDAAVLDEVMGEPCLPKRFRGIRIDLLGPAWASGIPFGRKPKTKKIDGFRVLDEVQLLNSLKHDDRRLETKVKELVRARGLKRDLYPKLYKTILLDNVETKLKMPKYFLKYARN